MVDERSAATTAAPWGLGQVVAGLVAGYVVANVAVIVLAGVSGQRPAAGAPLSVGLVSVDLVGLWVGLVGAVVVSARRASSSVTTEFGWRLRPWPDIPLGLLV
ncbi:MAG: hypothetical protein ACRDYD_01135, partial [Acidimicrobiales bacterium]